MEEKNYLILVYVSYFLSATLLSFLINGLFIKFVSTLGMRNLDESQIRWNTQARPSLGGISFFLIFLLSVASYPIFFGQQSILLDKQLLGILAASTLAFLMGLSDDAYNTKPLLKFLIQISCGVILISTGTYIKLFSNIYFDYMLTLFWVIGLMNSINMLDNMDSITTIVSITIIMNALFIIFLNSDFQNIHILLLTGIMAALIGFLYFNWYPAKMFMGDTGSQFLGLFLAAISILYFWNTEDIDKNLIQSKQFFVAILAFAIPIIDTISVVINRISKGRSPFIGGKDHTTHSFFFMGLSEKQVALLYASIGLVSMGLNILIIKYIEEWGYLHIALFTIYFVVLFLFMYMPTRKYGNN